MAKIIQFPQADINNEAKTLVEMSNAIDSVILSYLNEGKVEAKDVVGLLSHRIGNILSHIEDKEKLWEICRGVLEKQALLDRVD